MQSLSTLLEASFLTGLATHALLYRYGEWDLKAPTILATYILLFTAFFTLESTLSLQDGSALHLLLTHIAGVYTSITLYRAFFHRLHAFPGPFLARISNFYVAYLSARRLQLYKETERLHKVHGDYVRLGPTQLSVVNPDAFIALYGPQAHAGVSKGPWYNILHPTVSLQMERAKKVHARRRKVWDMGFSAKALRNYEGRVTKYTDQLVSAVERRLDTTNADPGAERSVRINASKWFNYYSFDVMGDLAFGKSFDMLVNGDDTYILTALHGDATSIMLFRHLPWLLPFFKLIPRLNAEYLKVWEFLDGLIEARMQNEPEIPDVFSWVLKDFRTGPKTVQDQLNLHGDAELIVAAGSDTTAGALTVIFFYLATNPGVSKQLQDELDGLDELSHKNLGGIDLLDGIINEALRLHPPVPSGTQRVTPPEGLRVGDVYLPGDVIVWSPMHTVFRDERSFERPNEFIPTRWTTEPHLVKNKSVFIPFNAGPYSCVGKQLALMELRCVTGEMMKRYDVCLAPGQSKEAFLDGLRDTFTLALPPLSLSFRRR